MAVDTPSAVVKPRLRGTLVDLLRSVLQDLRVEESAPRLVESRFPVGWVRQQQEVLVAGRPRVWVAPLSISQVGCLDRFPQMAEVRQVISEDVDLRCRVDTVVGPWFSMTDRRLDLLLFKELLDPLVVETGSYYFEEDRFDVHYSRLERGLLAIQVRIVDYVPVCGFDAALASVDLAGGFVLARMSDLQLNQAVYHGAVSIERTLSVAAIQVSRLTQWALGRTQAYPLHHGHNPMPDGPPPDWAALGDAGDRLVTALRVVCGGSVAVTRCLRVQHEDDFPVMNGASALLSRVTPVDFERPAVLTPDQVQPLREVFAALDRADVRGDRVLALALRRLVFAGVRSDPVDRLLDLMIAAEALFLKHGNADGASRLRNAKGEPAARRAAELLAHHPHLKRELRPDADAESAVYWLVKTCYDRRNAEMHADADPAVTIITRLDGTAASEIAAALPDLDRIIRLALQRTLEDSAAEPSTC
jgi:hypothetical protein